MKVVWVVAGGHCTAEQLSRHSRGHEHIICADSGAEVVMAARLLPSLVVGDFDSLDPARLAEVRRAGVQVVEYAVEKDASDVELALDQALVVNPTELTLWGGWGSRWDHSLANINLLAGLASRYPSMQIKMVDSHNVLRFVNQELSWQGPIGSPVSLLPYSPVAEGVTSQGLHYPLLNATLWREATLGISNHLCEERASVMVKSGLLMLMHSYDAVL